MYSNNKGAHSQLLIMKTEPVSGCFNRGGVMLVLHRGCLP